MSDRITSLKDAEGFNEGTKGMAEELFEKMNKQIETEINHNKEQYVEAAQLTRSEIKNGKIIVRGKTEKEVMKALQKRSAELSHLQQHVLKVRDECCKGLDRYSHLISTGKVLSDIPEDRHDEVIERTVSANVRKVRSGVFELIHALILNNSHVLVFFPQDSPSQEIESPLLNEYQTLMRYHEETLDFVSDLFEYLFRQLEALTSINRAEYHQCQSTRKSLRLNSDYGLLERLVYETLPSYRGHIRRSLLDKRRELSAIMNRINSGKAPVDEEKLYLKYAKELKSQLENKREKTFDRIYAFVEQYSNKFQIIPAEKLQERKQNVRNAKKRKKPKFGYGQSA